MEGEKESERFDKVYGRIMVMWQHSPDRKEFTLTFSREEMQLLVEALEIAGEM